jgi:hypothetical protein
MKLWTISLQNARGAQNFRHNHIWLAESLMHVMLNTFWPGIWAFHWLKSFGYSCENWGFREVNNYSEVPVYLLNLSVLHDKLLQQCQMMCTSSNLGYLIGWEPCAHHVLYSFASRTFYLFIEYQILLIWKISTWRQSATCHVSLFYASSCYHCNNSFNYFYILCFSLSFSSLKI